MTAPIIVPQATTRQQSRLSNHSSEIDPSEHDDLKNLNTAMKKTSVCRHWSRGHCKFGESCGFAHGGTELRKPLKTAVCRHWGNGRCRKGDECGFAHGEQELGTPQAVLLTIDSQEPLDPVAAQLPTGLAPVPANRVLVLSSKKKVWRSCTVLSSDESAYEIRYDGYSAQFDEYIPKDSDRLILPSRIHASEEPATIGSKVIVLFKRKRIWRQCTVIDTKDTKIKVHYDGYNESLDEWLEAESECVRHYDAECLSGKKSAPLLPRREVAQTQVQAPLAVEKKPSAVVMRTYSKESSHGLSSLPGSMMTSSHGSMLQSSHGSMLVMPVLSGVKLATETSACRLRSSPQGLAPSPIMQQATWAGPTNDDPASCPPGYEEETQSSCSSNNFDSSIKPGTMKSVDTPNSTVNFSNAIMLQTPDIPCLPQRFDSSLVKIAPQPSYMFTPPQSSIPTPNNIFRHDPYAPVTATPIAQI